MITALIYCVLSPAQIIAQIPEISVRDSVLTTLTTDFYGIQYHKNTYNDPALLNKMAPLPVKYLRLWAKPHEIHPDTSTWNWTDLDNRIQETLDAGYQPMVCIFQSEDWYTGSASDPWWNDENAVQEWYIVVEKIIKRYKEDLHHIILFDELNYLHPDNSYYISFSQSAELYLETARRIKAIAPSIKIGGPSGFSGWENGHWANYVYDKTDEDSLLSFISSNIFLSWDKDDTNKEIMDRTIWYEEAPKKIRSMINPDTPPRLMLDAYNASALWTIDGTKDGELWTDPRNVNAFGGVYQSLAQLHAAKGGFDITLRWETIGGYGIFDWYPQFNELPPYHAWKLITGPGGLLPGSSLIQAITTEEPLTDLPHHSGVNVEGYTVQPFAVRTGEGSLNLILVNKYQSEEQVKVLPPAGMNSYRFYQFHKNRVDSSSVPLYTAALSDSTKLTLPPQSISILAYSEQVYTAAENENEIPSSVILKQNYPNPFNPSTSVTFYLPESMQTSLEVFDLTGRKAGQVYRGRLGPGTHTYKYDASGLASGIYLYRLTAGNTTLTRKLMLLK